jgi:hypothetical protein
MEMNGTPVTRSEEHQDDGIELGVDPRTGDRALPADELDWEPILDLLPRLEANDFDGGRWEGGEEVTENVFAMPYVSLDETASELVARLYDEGVIASFDWSEWMSARGTRLYESEAELRSASLEDCRRLLTAHVRADRFAEGHLLGELRAGHVQAVLRQAVLRRVAVLLGEHEEGV